MPRWRSLLAAQIPSPSWTKKSKTFSISLGVRFFASILLEKNRIESSFDKLGREEHEFDRDRIPENNDRPAASSNSKIFVEHWQFDRRTPCSIWEFLPALFPFHEAPSNVYLVDKSDKWSSIHLNTMELVLIDRLVTKREKEKICPPVFFFSFVVIFIWRSIRSRRIQLCPA